MPKQYQHKAPNKKPWDNRPSYERGDATMELWQAAIDVAAEEIELMLAVLGFSRYGKKNFGGLELPTLACTVVPASEPNTAFARTISVQVRVDTGGVRSRTRVKYMVDYPHFSGGIIHPQPHAEYPKECNSKYECMRAVTQLIERTEKPYEH